jgi:hypothetical protein
MSASKSTPWKKSDVLTKVVTKKSTWKDKFTQNSPNPSKTNTNESNSGVKQSPIQTLNSALNKNVKAKSI